MGQRLGEYVVRRPIGSGGMSLVYEGEHLAMGRRVAIKLIRPEHLGGPSPRDLLSEARAASAIHHRGIIDIVTCGDQPGTGQYLVMEYLQGRSLAGLIQQRAPLPLAEGLTLLGEILEPLAAAHAVGVIHRDLKPSNIFIVRQSDGSEYVKVLDFGLARRINAPPGTVPPTCSNMLIGTPQYMAPEQIRCEAVGPRADLYAVGLVAFEMLTGRHPFPGRSPMETMAHHLGDPPPAPSSLVATLPHWLDELVLRLLAKEPSLRPASASDVLRELKRLSRQPGTVAPVDSPIARRARVRWDGAAGALLASALGVLMLPSHVSPLPPQRTPPPPVREPLLELPPTPELAEALQPAAPPPLPRKPSPPMKKKASQSAPRPLTDLPREPAQTGILHLVMKGAWAEVWVDGLRFGSAPPRNSYSLPAGEHALELRNPAFKPYQQMISIPPGATLTHTVIFEPSGLEPARPEP